MKILIFDNLFNQNFIFLPNLLNNFHNYFQKVKLNQFINVLQESINEPEITLISDRKKALNLKGKIQTQLFSNYRLDLDRSLYLDIREKIMTETKKNCIRYLKNVEGLFQNNKQLKTFGEIMEFRLIKFLNTFFGNLELIINKIQSKEYNRIIFFNCDYFFLEFISSQDLKIPNYEIYTIPSIKIFDSLFKRLNYLSIILKRNFIYLKNCLRKEKTKDILEEKDKNIIFVASTKNQIKCVKPVQKILETHKNLNPIIFSNKNYRPIINVIKLVLFIRNNKKLMLNNVKPLSSKIIYESLKLENIIELFFAMNLTNFFLSLYIYYFHFSNFSKKFPPSLVILTNEEVISSKIITRICNIKNIPTIYIPHAAIPIYEEKIRTFEGTYITAAGIADIDYYIGKGEPKNKLYLTGASHYEYFYKEKIQGLKKIKDMFSNKEYLFEKNKPTILFTTSPHERKTNEKIISIVINSIKSLNLLDNFIIKIHPREDGIVQRDMARRAKADIVIIKDYDILKVINSCDLLISGSSTTILDAMIIGIPILLLDFINWDYNKTQYLGFAQEQYVKVIKNPNSLTDEIQRLIKNKELMETYSKELKRNSEQFSFYDKNDPPINKIVNLILKIIGE